MLRRSAGSGRLIGEKSNKASDRIHQSPLRQALRKGLPCLHRRCRDPASNYQLERIFALISEAQYSFHDLSWMSLDNSPPRTPRLNMAFELGLAVAFTKCSAPGHQWFVFDTVQYRLSKALSDLGGISARIHDRTPRSVLRALMNALARERHQPTACRRLDDERLCVDAVEHFQFRDAQVGQPDDEPPRKMIGPRDRQQHRYRPNKVVADGE